jgi:hypothetical protein
VGLREVSVPRGKLETLFLRIVQEAQEQHVVTGGAVAGGAVAEFLQGARAQEPGLIEQLVVAASRSAPQPVQPAAPAAPTLQDARAALEELLPPAAQAAPPPAGPQPRAPHPPPVPSSKADREVIDRLLRAGREDEKKS